VPSTALAIGATSSMSEVYKNKRKFVVLVEVTLDDLTNNSNKKAVNALERVLFHGVSREKAGITKLVLKEYSRHLAYQARVARVREFSIEVAAAPEAPPIPKQKHKKRRGRVVREGIRHGRFRGSSARLGVGEPE
jgi:hypothetical protein